MKLKQAISITLRCLLFTAILVSFSCVSSKKVLYFQDVPQAMQTDLAEAYQAKIIKNDKLSIVVSSTNQEASRPFNTVMLGLTQPGLSASQSSDVKNGYIVESDGCINFPILGRIKAAGLTREELADEINGRLEPYLKDDRIVNVQFLNFKVSVLGAVVKPGSYTVSVDRITLLEALALAGDLDLLATRSNVLVIREVEGKRYFERLDLRSKDLFESEFFYLHQNDVVYVEQGKGRMLSGGLSSVLPYVLSTISTVVTVVALLVK